MKGCTRLPYPVLTDNKLEFFYGILTLWESGKEPKIINNFRSEEIKKLQKRKDSNGHLILKLSDFNDKTSLQLSEIRFRDVKNNKGLSILSHIRHAFAHNRIWIEENDRILHIENVYNGELKLKAFVAFDVLKELIDTLVGQQNSKNQVVRTNTKAKPKQNRK